MGFSIYPFEFLQCDNVRIVDRVLRSTMFINKKIALVRLVKNLGKMGFYDFQRKITSKMGLYNVLSTRLRAQGFIRRGNKIGGLHTKG